MTARRVPAEALVLGAVVSVQFGAALAKTIFDEAGPAGTVFLRTVFAAVVLFALWRPALRGYTREQWRVAAGFGLALGTMNLFFYEAIDRIPLGAAVTFEFVGPLAVAVIGAKRGAALVWALLAGVGVVTLAFPGETSLDALGVALALLAGGCWAAYILMSARAGRVFEEGATGLVLAIVFSSVLLLPIGIADGGDALLDPQVLALGAGVAMLSSAIPYSLEFEALRRLPEHIFGVLLSLEPAFAALAGFMVLGQELSAREAIGIGLVVLASAGAAREARYPPVRDG
ncbi:MAG: EamA family transporter [Thermoleophilaceae bacterium]|nr:EamA family transporter [Thermoleophilaceae bacterium]